MKVLVIGAGNMGLTYAEGMSKSKLLNNNNIMVLDNSEEKLKELDEIPYFDAHRDLKECVPSADIIFIAVKPFHAESVFENIKPYTNKEQIIVSVMAGVTIAAMQKMSGLDKVVRAMPNLPAQIGKGLTSFVASAEVSSDEASAVETLLSTTGKSLKVSNENFIDASTGISGSGPAYVFFFMESMMKAAAEMGFSKEDGTTLVTQTFAGAVELFSQSDITPREWMDRVASKGGTTRAALNSLEDNKVDVLIRDAAYAAFNRAIELGEEH
ncbi:pyrroline-5-carboxylate reductase [Tamlana sp. 2_MG-2023]|uniref:pyrroline-5-carboxylate reductase n=1 Tax=unclassified Tamlana TaxID=2614803 RepID=UPI0026E48411|nr:MULTISPECIES: pyrroline-5-carboxylate reductase [unclassified Tamlana]MDO6758799.1 pyrroline-5-carboxylate reductase [Tamlana sp. 2_MG-2023]MDO6789498.1 pyrroline-5-carboxylate reductase [Tamlana sp. 1_MG-2023]